MNMIRKTAALSKQKLPTFSKRSNFFAITKKNFGHRKSYKKTAHMYLKPCRTKTAVDSVLIRREIKTVTK